MNMTDPDKSYLNMVSINLEIRFKVVSNLNTDLVSNNDCLQPTELFQIGTKAVRDRPPEFSKMKIFFGTSVSDTLKPVDNDGPNRFSKINRFLC